MLPRAPRFKRPLLRCKACDPKSGSQWTCSTSCGCSSVRLPTGGGALVRFDFQKVAAPDGFAPSTSRVRAGRSRCLSYRAIRSANRSCTGLSPIPAACVATNALAEFEMVGHLGAAPSVSPIRTARIAVFLVPDEVVEPRGVAPRSTQCHCVVLLLDDGPEMERAPGLAPGKSGFASRRLDDFGIARVCEMG